jgi:hypothetical protein
MRTLLIVVALLASVLAVPGSASADNVTAAGVMTITTDRSVTTTIDVPEGVTVGHGSVELTAAADWQGLLLRPTDGDGDGLSLTVMRYPAGGLTSSIRLATEDAGEPGPAGFVQGQAAGRGCSQDCRIPPGTYDLMAVVRGGGPLTAALTLDGLDGERTLNGGELDVLPTSIGEKSFDETYEDGVGTAGISTGTGGGWSEAASIGFLEMTSVVDAESVARVGFRACFRRNSGCAGSEMSREYVANAAQRLESAVDFGYVELAAGEAGHLLSASASSPSTLRIAAQLQTLRVRPGITDWVGVAAFGGGIPSQGEAVDFTLRNTGTRRVAVESVKIQQLAGTGGLGGVGAGWVDVGHLCDDPGCTTVLEGPIEPDGDVKVQTDTSRLAPGDHRVVWTFIDDSPTARELPAEERERYVEYGTFFVYL